VTKLKICGVTLADDAARASAAGADYVGLNFWPKSKRHIAPERAALIAGAARGAGNAEVVGVFVDADPDEITAVMALVDLDVIQLHGNESPEEVVAVAVATKRPVWKAIAVASSSDLDRLETWPAEALILDAPAPGSGRTFDWELAKEARRRYPARLFALAGGLHAENVGAAIAAVQPWAVDVASGVEAAPGVKDAAKIAAFVAAVRGAAR
jgi:phosphoribosylanthranilate isomerase